jgi:hypothetical protein
MTRTIWKTTLLPLAIATLPLFAACGVEGEAPAGDEASPLSQEVAAKEGGDEGGDEARDEPGAAGKKVATCDKRTQGGETSCKPADVWRAYAKEDCGTDRLLLTSFTTSEACDGGFRRSLYTCCPLSGSGEAPKPDAGPKAEPAPRPDAAPGPKCATEILGGETSCKPAEVWKGYASELCGRRGLTLARLLTDDACDGGFRTAKASCCPAPTAPVPAPACTKGSTGSKTSCNPVEA